MNEYNIAVVGSEGVGKTILIFQLIHGQFVRKYVPTKFSQDTYCKRVVIDGETCTLNILDTAAIGKNNDISSDIENEYFKNSDGFLVVFAINNSKSFRDICELISHIRRVNNDDEFPIVLAVTKCDLPNRQIDFNVVANYAYDSGILLIETSADMQICIKDAFYSLVREIRNSKEMKRQELLQAEKLARRRRPKRSCNIL